MKEEIRQAYIDILIQDGFTLRSNNPLETFYHKENKIARVFNGELTCNYIKGSFRMNHYDLGVFLCEIKKI